MHVLCLQLWAVPGRKPCVCCFWSHAGPDPAAFRHQAFIQCWINGITRGGLVFFIQGLVSDVQNGDSVSSYFTRYTKLLQYCWLYSLSCTLHPCDLFYFITSLLLPFTYLPIPPPPSPLATSSLFPVSESVAVLLYLFVCFEVNSWSVDFIALPKIKPEYLFRKQPLGVSGTEALSQWLYLLIKIISILWFILILQASNFI